MTRVWALPGSAAGSVQVRVALKGVDSSLTVYLKTISSPCATPAHSSENWKEPSLRAIIVPARSIMPKPLSEGPPSIAMAPLISAALTRAAEGVVSSRFFLKYSIRRAEPPPATAAAMLVPCIRVYSG